VGNLFITRTEEKLREEERRRAVEADLRLVLDKHGTVRYACDYEGNVEEGLARHEARYGKAAVEAIMAHQPIGADPDDYRDVADFAQ
jgi:hypothetical protein